MSREFEEAVSYLGNIPRFAKKHTLDHTKRLYERLGVSFPEDRIIHVAGTNGKGSVCNYLSALLEAGGFSVMLFTSPHLVSIRERFRLGKKTVSQELFLEAFDRIRVLAREAEEEEGLTHPTFFEFLFLMQMELAGRFMPDYLILETGLGGLLDATNVFDAPALCIITGIGLDHCLYLGDTKEQIAAQKAGIVKEKVPLVLSLSDPAADRVIEGIAKEKNAPLYPVSDRDLTPASGAVEGEKTGKKSIDFSYQSLYYSIDLSLRTGALYQRRNAAVALRGYEILRPGGCLMPAETVKAALDACFWPCRMEEVRPGVIIDGAHNEDGVEAFLESVAADGCRGRRTLVFAAAADKDIRRMAERIAKSGLFSLCRLTRFSGGRSAEPEKLQTVFASCGQQTECIPSPREAVLGSLPVSADDSLYIAGSLYLAGEIKALFQDPGTEGGEDT